MTSTSVYAASDFEWWDDTLTVFDHPHNRTVDNERGVEIPVALRWLSRQDGRGLEVGNVLQHYGHRGHRVVDRWEKAPGVEAVDVFDVSGRYRWILAVSTLEHVRWDEPGDRDPDAAQRALWHLHSLLSPGGAMLVTVPLGYHPAFDRFLLSPRSGAERACTIIRSGAEWRQTERLTPRPYGQRTAWAESVYIGEWRGA